MRLKIYLLLSIIAYTCSLALGNGGDTKAIKPQRYYAINYSNDVWQKSDRYLTQSFSLEYVNPIFNHFLFNKLLIKSKEKQLFESGIKVMQNVYTPTSIDKTEIQTMNQPYSATLSLTQFYKEINTSKKYLLYSEIQVGVLGSNALGKQMQTGVHKAIGDNLPKGWDNQLPNSPIINYNVQYSKSLLSKRFLEILPYGTVRIGTLNYDVSAGTSVSIGNKPSIFSFTPKRFEYSFTFNTEVKQVFYNAVLQGSYFKNSTYRLLPSEIQNIVFLNDLKYTIRYHNFRFSFSQTMLSKQYKKGLNHVYNSVSFGVYF